MLSALETTSGKNYKSIVHNFVLFLSWLKIVNGSFLVQNNVSIEWHLIGSAMSNLICPIWSFAQDLKTKLF